MQSWISPQRHRTAPTRPAPRYPNPLHPVPTPNTPFPPDPASQWPGTAIGFRLGRARPPAVSEYAIASPPDARRAPPRPPTLPRPASDHTPARPAPQRSGPPGQPNVQANFRPDPQTARGRQLRTAPPGQLRRDSSTLPGPYTEIGELREARMSVSITESRIGCSCTVFEPGSGGGNQSLVPAHCLRPTKSESKSRRHRKHAGRASFIFGFISGQTRGVGPRPRMMGRAGFRRAATRSALHIHNAQCT